MYQSVSDNSVQNTIVMINTENITYNTINGIIISGVRETTFTKFITTVIMKILKSSQKVKVEMYK